MKGTLLVAAALVAGAVGGYLAGRVADQGGQSGDGSAQLEVVDTSLAEVIRTDLVQTDTLMGELRFADPGRVVSQQAGTVTWTPEPGEFVGAGDVAYEVDGVAVTILPGDRPAWRAFGPGMTDGPDILQLEEGLSGLGYDPGEIDETFDSDTGAAIEAWQGDRADGISGEIALGQVLFVPDGFRVGEVLSEEASVVGPGVPVYRTTSIAQEVVIELDPRDLDLISLGAAVSVTLPDGVEVPGEIVEIGRVVRRLGLDPEGPEIVDITIEVDATGIDLDRAPVDVAVESDRASGVLAVPVRALVSLSDGGYAVELTNGDETSLVGVTIGDFADGLVEIEGPLREGDLVVVPVG